VGVVMGRESETQLGQIIPDIKHANIWVVILGKRLFPANEAINNCLLIERHPNKALQTL